MIFDKDNLLKEIIRKTLNVLEQLGVDDDAATGYTDFDIYNSDGRLVVEVKTSFNDEIVKKLADELNPIVQKYDDNSYFEIDDSGNIFAYLVDNSLHLKDSLKELDKKLFDEFDESLELEALYEATQTDLTADEERKIKDFISKPGITAEEAKTFITGMQKSKGIHEDIEMVDYTPDVTMTFENACGIDEVPNNYNIGDTLVCDSDLCLEDGITIPAGKTFILIDTCGACDCPEIKFDNEFYNLIHSGEGAPLIALVMDLVDFMDNDEINPYLPVMESKRVTESLNESLSNKTVQKTNTKSLRESLKERDSEDFRNLSESFELESLYESVKDKFDKEAITQIKECVENKKNSSREIAKLIEGLSKGDKTYLFKLSESFSENERFAYELAKEMNLDFEGADNLLHDLNNLRADEWFDTVLDRCSDETIEKFITTYNLGKAQFESLEEDTSDNTVDVKELIRQEFHIKPWKNFKQTHFRKLMYKAYDVEFINGFSSKKSREDNLENGIKKLEDFLSDIDGCSVKFEYSYDGSLPVPVVNVRCPLQLESLEEGLVHFLETYKGYDIHRDVATGDFFATDSEGNEKFVDCDSVEDVKKLIDSSLTEDLGEEDIYSLLDNELGGRGYDKGIFDVLLDYCKNNSISEEQLRRLDTDELEILTLMAEGEEVTNWRASDEDNEYWLSVEKSLRDKFNLNESLNESKEIDSILEKVNNAFKETGFELDKNIKHENPSKGLFTDYHYQIVNLNHNFDVEDEEGSYEKLKEISEPLINRLHKLEGNGEEFNFTWNFGVDKEGHCTAGVDLRLSKELKDKDTINESLDHKYIDISEINSHRFPNLYEALNIGAVSLIVIDNKVIYNEKFSTGEMEEENIDYREVINEIKEFAKDWDLEFNLDLNYTESLNEDTKKDTRVVQYDITLTSDSLSRPRDIENALESYGIEVLGIEYGPYDEEFNGFTVDMVDSEDVDSEHIIEYLTNHSINVVDAQPTASWIINDYMGKLSEGLEDNDSTQAYELANNIVDYVSEVAPNIWIDLRNYENLPYGIIELQFDIDNGDWKHEHLYFDSLVKDYLEKNGYKIIDAYEEGNGEEDGGDVYSATHQFILRKVEG